MDVSKKNIYLDYSASTPVDPIVLRAMNKYFTNDFGNPQSVHAFGQKAISAVDRSREIIANSINANFSEIIFTGSATESNNLALRGIVKKFLNENKKNIKPRLIISSIEHESVLRTVEDIKRNNNIEVIYSPVNKEGIVDIDFIKRNINERTIGISVMYVNNEIGTIEPIKKISEIIKDFESISKKHIYFHTDAVQAFQFLNCDVSYLGVDLMTLSSHKIYGPKGIGALYIKNNTPSKNMIEGIILGGGQEFGIRSGTENTPSIVGFAKAFELRSKRLSESNKKIGELKKYFWQNIKRIYSQAEINGISDFYTQKNKVVPNILNVYFPNHKSEDILTKLDLLGVSASSGSACNARALQSSYVIFALCGDKSRAESSVRFSLGVPTKKQDILYVLNALKKVL
jgi:cysteine desulfurase